MAIVRSANGWIKEGYEDFGLGIFRNFAFDSPDFPSGGLWDALNIVYDLDSDNPEKLGGSELLDTITGTPTITGLLDYADGTELIATAEDGKIYKRTTGTFSAVTGGSGFDTSTDTRWFGGMGYGKTSGSNLLVLSNGIDAPQRYNGTNIAALAGSPPATGKFFTYFNGRYWLFDGELAYYSVGDDCEDWVGSGSGHIGIALGYGGNITGATVFSGNLFIFKKSAIFYIPPTNIIDDSIVLSVSGTKGAVAHATIADVGGSGTSSLFFLSDYGLEFCKAVNTTANFVVDSNAPQVSSLLSNRNRSTQHLSVGVANLLRKEYYCWFPTSTKSIPSTGLIGNVARGAVNSRWTRNDIANITAATMYRVSGEYTQIYGTSLGTVYKLHSGHDRDGSPYRGYIYTKAYTQGDVESIKIYNRYYVSVRVNGVYPVTVNPVLGRYKMTRIPSRMTAPVLSPSKDGWAEGRWGTAYWGGDATTGKWNRLRKARRGTYFRLSIYTLGANQWFRLSGIDIESALGSEYPLTR